MDKHDQNMKNENNNTEEGINNLTKEDENMNAVAEKREYKRLDFSKLSFSDKNVTTEEALRNVVPFHWSEEVLQGNKEVIIKKAKDK